MIRGLGILVGLALIFVGVGQAIARDWTIDGWFLILAGIGLLILLLAALTAYEQIPEDHPDALGSLDLLERRDLSTTAGGQEPLPRNAPS